MKMFAVVATLVALFSLPAYGKEFGFDAKDFTLTVSGQGVSTHDFDNTSFSLTVDGSYFVSHNLEVGVRQTLSFLSDADNDFAGATIAHVDVNFTLLESVPKLVGFVGARGGYVYGYGDDHWSIGPEAGVKYFLTTDAYLYGSVGYDIDVNNGIDEGQWVYGIGIGVKL